MRRIAIAFVLFVLFVGGCRRARHFDLPTSGTAEPTPAVKPVVEPGWAWLPPDTHHPAQPGPPMVFVAEDADPAFWRSLPDRPFLHRPETLLFDWPGWKLPALVRIKVPAGLPDPSPRVPPVNPLTRGKWDLGRRLFYDTTWLSERGVACATCHRPERGFTDGLVHEGVRTPTLVNVVYNTRLFSDGRVGSLEEVVQRSPEDELLPDNLPPFRHVWGGVVHRLNRNAALRDEFDTVFATPATQDAVGKALATYLRTLLAGDSLQDRATAAAKARGVAVPESRDYEAVLDKNALAALDQPEGARVAFADRFSRGRHLFQNNCTRCHPGPLYTDHGFHNLGVGPPEDLETGTGLGRFATLPVGLKAYDQVGAYATPSLRGLTHTGPYLHTGEKATLAEVVAFHARGGGRRGNYLDPGYRKVQEDNVPTLTPDEQADLVLFLRGLSGSPVHPDLGPAR